MSATKSLVVTLTAKVTKENPFKNIVYEFECGNGTTIGPLTKIPAAPDFKEVSVTCTYTSAQSYTAKVTVTQGTGASAVEDIAVTAIQVFPSGPIEDIPILP